jgi:beta-mannanase
MQMEGLGQQALDTGISIGNTATAANRSAGGLLASGMNAAAATMQPANSYSPAAGMLAGAGNYLNQQANPQQQQYRFDPYTGQQIKWGQ